MPILTTSVSSFSGCPSKNKEVNINGRMADTFVCIENPREPIAKLLELIRKLERLLDVKSM